MGRTVPDFLADPFECIARTNIVNDPCKILIGRNTYVRKPTKVVHIREEEGDRYAFGNVSAMRDPRHGVTLRVSNTPGKATDTPYMKSHDAIAAADCLRAAVANVTDGSCVGKSIEELAWDKLMEVMDRLMRDEPKEDGRDPGRAEGMATIIAIFQNPYLPNINMVRTKATDRWYAENPDEA